MRRRQLAAMLAEQSPVYAGRGSQRSGTPTRVHPRELRDAGLPPEAVPFVLEELETGQNPTPSPRRRERCAGAQRFPPRRPRCSSARSRACGARTTLSRSSGSRRASTEQDGVTALSELASHARAARTAREQALPSPKGARRSRGRGVLAYVSAPSSPRRWKLSGGPTRGSSLLLRRATHARRSRRRAPTLDRAIRPAELALENQDGARLSFSEAFSGRPTALAFFYTRCMNPEKCSLTVTRLARLARRPRARGPRRQRRRHRLRPGFDRPRG